MANIVASQQSCQCYGNATDLPLKWQISFLANIMASQQSCQSHGGADRPAIKWQISFPANISRQSCQCYGDATDLALYGKLSLLLIFWRVGSLANVMAM